MQIDCATHDLALAKRLMETVSDNSPGIRMNPRAAEILADALAKWHPHLNCPMCQGAKTGSIEGEVSHIDLTIWLRDHHSQSHQITAERFLKEFTVTRKDKA